MQPLQARIIAYVKASNGLVSLDKLVSVAAGAGFSEIEVLTALEHIGTKLKSTVRKGVVYYQIPPPAKKEPGSHLIWLRENYKELGENEKADHPIFADIDFSYLLLKGDELRDYKASLRGNRYNRHNAKPKRSKNPT